MPDSGILVMETVSHAEHQVVGRLEVLKVIPDVQESVPAHLYFERQHLIKPSHISSGYHIGADAYADGEIRHDILGTSRQPQSQLAVNTGFEKLLGRRSITVSDNNIFGINICASVVHPVER